MTVVVLALDALDAGLVEHFNLDEFRLESSGPIETFAYSKDDPYTPEVWTTVATGVGPEEHGVTGAGTSEWGNPLLEFASKFTGRLSESTRGTLGRFIRNTTNQRETIGRTDRQTAFDRDNAVVRNWPGVTDGRDLQQAWDLMNAVAEGMSKQEFERKLLCLCAEQFGWAREILHHDVSLAGVHVHTLDAAGHAYADDPESLERVYRRVGAFVAELVTELSEEDELLLLSDHGMSVNFLDADADADPATHSWRAYASATTDEIPESVYDVPAWIDRHLSATDGDVDDIDMPTERLRELGYIE
ncbi:alkaline phosphatase family protein [Halorussus limi]|uniref:Alkaline phosphatase family protein n=1 Tax=Halorussus limi TaxID=2938695 RepID=A0A8U0HTR8_9EURY|nr:alkaline phosphatase family protein [Halorussus limi]UPV74287.1 alkaline phosphatase family protein [Halorussus limi]